MTAGALRVALNCSILTRGVSGSATGTRAIAAALGAAPGVDLQELWPRTKPRRSAVYNAVAQARWDLRDAAVAAADSDVLVSPCNIGLSLPRQRHVLVIHDTMVLSHPTCFDLKYAAYARLLFGSSVMNADAILVPSDFSAGKVRQRWPRAREPRILRWPVSVRVAAPRTSAPTLTVMMVGETAPHKRQRLGIEAVLAARQASRLDISLVMVGPDGASEPEVATLARRFRWLSRVRGLSSDHLGELYKSAFCLIQPSLDEGYGLPVAEACAWALPTIHSGAGALPELAPGAVADGSSHLAYRDALLRLLGDSTAYASASAAALKAANRFTWASFTTTLLSVIAPT